MSYARGITHGLALGAGMMFLLDPRQGGARRAYVRDKSLRAAHEVEDALQIGRRDLAHRVEGAVARMFSPPSTDVDDATLVSRVRARLGHVCTHAGTIEVHAKGNGCIELKGPVLAHEAATILAEASKVPGVREIDDDLERHDQPDLPGLQGEHPARPALARMWTPATRLFVGGGAAVVALGSLFAGHPFGFLVGGASALAVAKTIVRRSPAIPKISAGARKVLREAEQAVESEVPL